MLELSIMNHGPQFVAELQALLAQFKHNTRAEVRLRVLDWREAWGELVRVTLYNAGSDISEIGSTWLSEFVNMMALRPFANTEIERLGGQQHFLPAAWGSVTPATTSSAATTFWAVPWLADMRLIHYRQDLFEKAGVEAHSAFQSPLAVLETCARLQAAGVAQPMALPSRRSRMTLHHLASWVWGNGGDFLSPDGKKALFVTEQARAAIHAYFDLASYLPSDMRDLDENQSDAAFLRGAVAITFSGPWLQRSPDRSSEVVEHARQALLPGVPYIGGSQLVIWKHSPYVEPALRLIRHLNSTEAQARLVQASGLFPTRWDVLAREPFQSDPFFQTAAEGLKTGRAFPASSLWGLVENKLAEAFAAIWSDIFLGKSADIHAIVDAHLEDAAQRLNTILASD
ncbi:MAG TPA: extracellular solute-binding protein [Anaerolineae bacterium]|nr:extracellular solute-binding protein [Anaerolineae bacterium]